MSETLTRIDPTKPSGPVAYTADVRANFQAVQDQIDALEAQAGVPGPPGPQGPPGADSIVPGPPGPSIVSTDPNNFATLGTDSFIYVPPSLPLTGGLLTGALAINAQDSADDAGIVSALTIGASNGAPGIMFQPQDNSGAAYSLENYSGIFYLSNYDSLGNYVGDVLSVNGTAVGFVGQATMSKRLLISSTDAAVQITQTDTSGWPALVTSGPPGAAAGYWEGQRSGTSRWSVVPGDPSAEGAPIATTTTASVAAGQNVIPVASATGMTVGMSLVATGVPVGATIITIAALNLTISANTTGGGVASGAAVTVYRNTGTNFGMTRFADNGAALGTAFGISRQTGAITLGGATTVGPAGTNALTTTPGSASATAATIGLSGTGGLRFNTNIGFNAPPIAKPTINGACAGNTAIKALLTALAAYGLITDNTTA
jgi:hypothetical protein